MPDQSAPDAADDAFGADLYRLLSEQGSDVVFSPVSVASVLQMALCGARGQTASELAGALHLDGSPDAAAAALRTLSALVASVTADGTVTFRAPAAVWLQAGLPLRPDFTARLGAAVAEADFAGAPQQARAQINRVVAEQTEEKITGLLPAARDRRPDPAGADQRHLPQGRLGPDLPGAARPRTRRSTRTARTARAGPCA